MGHPAAKAPHGAILSGVSCVSRSACVAVGDGLLAESWSGKVWSGMTVPEGGDLPQFFSSVSCITASLCEAVGDRTAIAASS